MTPPVIGSVPNRVIFLLNTPVLHFDQSVRIGANRVENCQSSSRRRRPISAFP